MTRQQFDWGQNGFRKLARMRMSLRQPYRHGDTAASTGVTSRGEADTLIQCSAAHLL